VPAKKLVVSTYLQYILLAVGVVVLVSFVRQLSGVLLTFLAAGVLAYTLNPVVRRLERWRVPRALAVVAVILVLTFAVVAGLLVVIVPAVGQVQSLIRDPQAIARQANSLVDQAQGLPYVGEYVVELDQDRILQLLRSNAPSAGQVVNVATGVLGGVFGVFGTLLNLLLMVLVSVYLLLDRERISRGVHNVIPEMVHDQVFELFSAVEQALIKYLKGQFLLCAVMGVIGWAIGFFAIGEYALLIGVWVAVTEIIPVLGAFLGAVPAVALALFVPDGGFTTALIVAGLFLLAQQVEGNILVPRIQGGSVGVHPLWVLFATLAGTTLYGIVGAIFAVPIVAIIASTFRYMRRTLLFERWANAPLKPADEEPTKLEADSLSTAAGVDRTRSNVLEEKP
jgi:predicted PurR-regulated permease PerM